MLSNSPDSNQNQFLFSGLSEMLNPHHELYILANRIPWSTLEKDFYSYYSKEGRPAKPVRLMVSLLLLKHMYDLGDETVIQAWVQNPYFQYFSGETTFQWEPPIDPSDLVHFRNRIGERGLEKIFKMSIDLHGDSAKEEVVIADTTVQEKNITYPTDVKLYVKIIKKCNKIAGVEGVKQRQRYTRVFKSLLLQQRFRNHPKNYKKARKAERKLKTIAGRLIRELERKLSEEKRPYYSEQFYLFHKVLNQQKSDKHKIYSLHEPETLCISKGKEHKRYEFGTKASCLLTKDSGIVVGALDCNNLFDGHTLDAAIDQYERLHNKKMKEIIGDRGYRGKRKIKDVTITIPRKEKGLTPYQKRKIRSKFKRRASIEPTIGHLKSDNRLGRNYYKGKAGDTINILLAAIGFNLRKWMRKIPFLRLFRNLVTKILSLYKYFVEQINILAGNLCPGGTF